MKRLVVGMLALTISCLPLAACGNPSAGTKADSLGTRQNPYPLGEEIQVDDAQISSAEQGFDPKKTISIKVSIGKALSKSETESLVSPVSTAEILIPIKLRFDGDYDEMTDFDIPAVALTDSMVEVGSCYLDENIEPIRNFYSGTDYNGYLWVGNGDEGDDNYKYVKFTFYVKDENGDFPVQKSLFASLTNVSESSSSSADSDEPSSTTKVSDADSWKEYISNVVSANSELSMESDDTTVTIFDTNAIQGTSVPGTKCQMYPKLKYLYSEFGGEKYCRPVLQLQLNTGKQDAGSGMLMYANVCEISSSAGNLRFSDSDLGMNSSETYSLSHDYASLCYIDSDSYDLEKVKNIVNGDNLQVKWTVATMTDGGNVEVNFSPDKKFIETINDYLELDGQIVKQY